MFEVLLDIGMNEFRAKYYGMAYNIRSFSHNIQFGILFEFRTEWN